MANKTIRPIVLHNLDKKKSIERKYGTLIKANLYKNYGNTEVFMLYLSRQRPCTVSLINCVFLFFRIQLTRCK
jgi:hypothetical protein